MDLPPLDESPEVMRILQLRIIELEAAFVSLTDRIDRLTAEDSRQDSIQLLQTPPTSISKQLSAGSGHIPSFGKPYAQSQSPVLQQHHQHQHQSQLHHSVHMDRMSLIDSATSSGDPFHAPSLLGTTRKRDRSPDANANQAQPGNRHLDKFKKRDYSPSASSSRSSDLTPSNAPRADRVNPSPSARVSASGSNRMMKPAQICYTYNLNLTCRPNCPHRHECLICSGSHQMTANPGSGNCPQMNEFTKSCCPLWNCGSKLTHPKQCPLRHSICVRCKSEAHAAFECPK
ncbi:hypothetical protein BDR26DRAFT_879624 [Obelidium mucronatum]|nr:hypothetical protein BDR26DRAFT_879624 [Obelidium mucronatum]